MKKAPAIIPAFWLLLISKASAGMTTITLTDIARARIDAISFFIVGYLLICWFVKLIWNQLVKSFPAITRLNYKQALGFVFVVSLLFYVVLTMISGARELLTPGAWEKQGARYRLREGEAPFPEKEQRRTSLRSLQKAIWSYAENHEGRAPTSPLNSEIDLNLWQFPGGGLYVLMPDVLPGVGRKILAYEPASAGGRRFILLSDGSIEDRSENVLATEIQDQSKR
ncbi:hypothetical protein JIN85_01330 [Luteolibacter pohnpeiensis]|uniref:Type II secretion system protein GspG C-terminal domain-containing protein n=1 Tax=Luteolibacter pohnpeiensis TaxID=454153 RepID=A0A934S7Z4_9BACT|nr:hypothetical protein [Luteolibacter pohnpeiensis]MBK1881034.1 hypothetical protein [Luteolibacter pohnpeiensis]